MPWHYFQKIIDRFCFPPPLSSFLGEKMNWFGRPLSSHTWRIASKSDYMRLPYLVGSQDPTVVHGLQDLIYSPVGCSGQGHCADTTQGGGVARAVRCGLGSRGGWWKAGAAHWRFETWSLVTRLREKTARTGLKHSVYTSLQNYCCFSKLVADMLISVGL